MFLRIISKCKLGKFFFGEACPTAGLLIVSILQTYQHIHIYTHTYKHTHMYTHICIHYTYTNTPHTHIMHICTYPKYPYTYICIYTYKYRHTIYAYTYAQTHFHISLPSLCFLCFNGQFK